MLLRRVTKHVNEQNWFAVGIDFIIVVFGVFIGIQIGNWNEELADDVRSKSYLERIASDLTQEITIYQDSIQFWNEVANYGLSAIDASNTGASPLTSWNILLAYFQASQTAQFFPSNATFEELKTAGDLDLIRDENLRGAISEYYAYPGSINLRESPRYREHVRSLIPLSIQMYIWSNCYDTDGALQQLKECPSPIKQTEVQSIVDQLNTNQNLKGELRYWISSLEVARLIASSNALHAKGLRNELFTQLGRDTREN